MDDDDMPSPSNGGGAASAPPQGALRPIVERAAHPSAPALRHSASSASLLSASGDPNAGPLPPRIALVAADPDVRSAVALTLSSSGPEVVPFATLADASRDPAPFVVLCVEDPIKCRGILLPTCAAGRARGYVVVGDVTPGYREAIFTTMQRYCDLARGTLTTPHSSPPFSSCNRTH